MKCTRSKTGLPIIAENGGGSTNTGRATIICSEDGTRLTPVFIPRGYSNGDHALFVAYAGKTIVVDACHSRAGEWVTVSQVARIGTNDDQDEIVLQVVGEYENGDGTIPDVFSDAVEAALNKARCYHCREPHYVDR